MAKFLSCEDRFEIESGLKEHMSFTEILEKPGRDTIKVQKSPNVKLFIRNVKSNCLKKTRFFIR